MRELKPSLADFDASCFNGEYVTGDVTPAYLDALERAREAKLAAKKEQGATAHSDINFSQVL